MNDLISDKKIPKCPGCPKDKDTPISFGSTLTVFPPTPVLGAGILINTVYCSECGHVFAVHHVGTTKSSLAM